MSRGTSRPAASGAGLIALAIALSTPAAADDAPSPAFASDTVERFREIGLRLAAGSGAEDIQRRVPQTSQGASLDLIFVLDELESLAEPTAHPDGAVVEACGPAPPAFRQLLTTDCLRALLRAERREWRLAAELAAQAHRLGRHRLAASLPAPPPQASDDQPTAAIESWNRNAMRALDAMARIGREWIKDQKRDDADHHARRIMERVRRILREPGIVVLRTVLHDSPEPRIAALASHLHTVADATAPTGSRLDAATDLAADYDAAMRTAFDAVVKDIRSRQGQACIDLVPHDLSDSLRPAGTECDAALGRVVGALDASARSTQYTPATQVLEAAFDERSLTLRLLLAKLDSTAEKAHCAEALSAMQATDGPARGGIENKVLGELAHRIATLVELCRPEINAAFAATAARWALRDCGDSAAVTNGAFDDLGHEAHDALGDAWDRVEEVMRSDEPRLACTSRDAHGHPRWIDETGRQDFSAATGVALGEFLDAAAEILDGVPVHKLRTVLDTVSVSRPLATEGDVNVLRTLCRLRDPRHVDDAGRQPAAIRASQTDNRVFEALFRDLGLESDGGQLCDRLADPRSLTDVERLVDLATDRLGGDGTTVHKLRPDDVRAAARRSAELSRRYAIRILAIAEAAALARATRDVIPLGPPGFGCSGDNGHKPRGLGTGARVALDMALDSSDPDAWTLRVTGTAGLVFCAANEKGGLRRVVSLNAWSGPLSLVLELDDERLMSAPDTVAAEWWKKVRTKADAALGDAHVGDDVLAEAWAKILPGLLRTTGIDLAADALLGIASAPWAYGTGGRYDADHGFVLPFAIRIGSTTHSACVGVPLSPEHGHGSPDCLPATDIGEVAGLFAWELFSPKLQELVSQASRAVGLDEAVAADAAAAVLDGLRTGRSGSDRIDTAILTVLPSPDGSFHALRLRVPAESFAAAFDRTAGTRTFAGALSGDLEVTLRFMQGVPEVLVGSVPTPVPRFLLRRFLGKDSLTDGVLSIGAEIAASATAEGRAPCGGRAQLPVAFGRDAPLVGVLGVVCFAFDDGRVLGHLVPDDEVTVTSPDGMWTFTAQVPEGCCELNDGKVELDMLVTSHDGLINVDNAWVTVSFDMRTGEWRLPDVPVNLDFYRAVQLSHRFAVDAAITDLRFGATGLEYATVAAAVGESAERAWLAIGEALPPELTLDAKDVTCDLHKARWLAQLLREGQVPAADPPPNCPSPPELEDSIEPIQGHSIAWLCWAKGDPPQTVTRCSIDFPERLSLCGTDLKLEIRWPRSGRQLRSTKLESCIQQRVSDAMPAMLKHAVEVEGLDLVGACSPGDSDPDSEPCGVGAAVVVDLQRPLRPLDPKGPSNREMASSLAACSMHGQSRLRFTGVLRFDGRIRVGTGTADAVHTAASGIAACAHDLAKTVAIDAANEIALRAGVDKAQLLKTAAKAIRQTLAGVRAALGDDASCDLRLRDGGDLPCKELQARHLRNDAINTLLLAKSITIAGTEFTLGLTANWDLPRIDPRDIPLSGGQDEIQNAWRGAAQSLADALNPRPSLTCRNGKQSDCLTVLANRLRRAAASSGSSVVSYRGGASINPAGKLFTLSVPLHLDLPILGVQAPVTILCKLDAQDWRSPTVAGCGAEAGIDSAVTGAVAQSLSERLVNKAFDLGLLTYRVIAVEEAHQEGHRLRIRGTARVLPDTLDQLPEMELAVVFDDAWRPSIDADYAAFLQSLTDDLKDAVNGTIGGILPVTIDEIVPLDRGPYGIPTAVALETSAEVGGLFSIAAPRLKLSADGIRVDGARRFVVSFTEGFNIPAPPFVICPTGGGIEDSVLVLKANTTVGECTAAGVVKHSGELRIDITNPLRIETDGALVLLGMIPLGSNTGTLDLSQPNVTQSAEIGGVAKDVISMTGEFTVQGDPMLAHARAKAALFGVPVGDGDFKLDLATGSLNTSIDVNLGFADGMGFVRTGRRFSRPRAEMHTSIRVGGFPLVDGDVMARPRAARVALTVLGARFGVAFPGLDAFTPSAIADALANLLTLDIRDLDEAMDALLSGNFVVNPFGRFGNADDGFGNDSDGAAGESAPGGKRPAREAVEAPSVPDEPPPRIRPPDDSLPGAARTVWFRADSGAVHIGFGPDGPDAQPVVIARHDPAHFAKEGVGLGVPFSVHDYGYVQLLGRTVAASPGCPAGPGQVAYLYRGTPLPLRGYYELCRVKTAAGPLSLDGLHALDRESLLDLSALNAALLAELGGREPPTDGADLRLLRDARLLDAPKQGLRGAVASQRPGELLVVMRGRFADADTCGTAAAPDAAQPWSGPHVFWLTGVPNTDDEAPILDAVAALWACTEGALARLDIEHDLLATGTTVALRHAAGGFHRIAAVPAAAPATGPDWLQAFVTDRRRAATTARRESQRALMQAAMDDMAAQRPDAGGPGSLCLADCEPVVIRVEHADGTCTVSVNDLPTGRFPDADDDDCHFGPGHAWLQASPGSHLVAATAGFGVPRSGMQFAAYVPDPAAFAQTPVLDLGSGRAGLTAEEYRLVTGFLALEIADGRTRLLPKVELSRNDAETMALVSPDGDGFRWYAHDSGRTHVFPQIGDSLPPSRRVALLPLLDEGPVRVDVAGNRLTLWFDETVRVYGWGNDANAWTHLLEMDRLPPADAAYEQLALADSIPRLDPAGATHTVAVVPPRGDEQSAWGYAMWTDEPESGRLFLAHTSPSPTPGRTRHRLALDEWKTVPGGMSAVWFDLRIPPNSGSVAFFAGDAESEADWDQVACLFRPNGTLAGSDDDGGSALPEADQRTALIPIPNATRETRYVAVVRNYLGGETGPLRVALGIHDTNNRSPAPTNESMCEGLGPSPDSPEAAEFQPHSVPGIGRAHGAPAFLGALADRLLQDAGELARYEVFRSRGGPHAARLARDGSALEMTRAAPDGALAVLAGFLADQAADLPPPYTWPLLTEMLAGPSSANTRQTGRAEVLPADVGERGWSIVLPADARSQTRTVFFKNDGIRRVRVTGATRDTLAAAVSYMVQTRTESIEVVRHDPIVALVHPRNCRLGALACHKSLVMLDANSASPVVQAAVDGRDTRVALSDHILDLFAHESTTGAASDPNWVFEHVRPDVHAHAMFRFAPSSAFRIAASSGWAGCLDLHDVDPREPGVLDLLRTWPDKPIDNDPWTLTDCRADRQWALTAGADTPVEGASAPRRALLLHSTRPERGMRLMAVPLQGAGTNAPVAVDGIDAAFAGQVAERVAGRLRPGESIVAAAGRAAGRTSDDPDLVSLETRTPPSGPGMAPRGRTRLLAFYRHGEDDVCTLSGVELARPRSAIIAETHAVVHHALLDEIREAASTVCIPVQRRVWSLVQLDGEWHVWERAGNGGPP